MTSRILYMSIQKKGNPVPFQDIPPHSLIRYTNKANDLYVLILDSVNNKLLPRRETLSSLKISY